MAQKYVAQPKENGMYEVARFNEITRQYEHVEDCLSEEDAIELAHSLNEHDRWYEVWFSEWFDRQIMDMLCLVIS